MTTPALQTIKRLFAVSRNQCAFPGCVTPLVEESGTVTGEIAHIKAASPNGPRYDRRQTEEERQGFENLLLLCSRHHTVIDSETDKYSVERLVKFKRNHELPAAVEITPSIAAVAQSLLAKYQCLIINNVSGQVAVHSPGVIQAGTINIKSSKHKVNIAPPAGSIANNIRMRSYIEYLISKYQEYQKQDADKEGRYKYMALYNGVKKEFGARWQILSETDFDHLVSYLKMRIDNTKVGRIRKKRNQKRYHEFSDHFGVYDA